MLRDLRRTLITLAVIVAALAIAWLVVGGIVWVAVQLLTLLFTALGG